MARVINPCVQITGLSASGQTDHTGTWNEDVSLTSYGVPTTASAVLIYMYSISGLWYGLRDPSDPTGLSGFQGDSPSDVLSSFIVPVSNGTIDLYMEHATNVEFWVGGYWEAGAVEWLTAGNELTRSTTAATAFTWDNTDYPAGATGIIVTQSELAGDTTQSFSIATATSPTAYSPILVPNTNGGSDILQYVIPLDSSGNAFVNAQSAVQRDYNIVGFIKQPITFVYDDNSGPTESPGTTGSWAAATYDYGNSRAGIGCMQVDGSALHGYWAAADTSDPIGNTPSQKPIAGMLMHTVKSDGTFNYYSEVNTTTHTILWFMGPCSMVYVNDAATLDGGEVEQQYPGTGDWSATSITMPTTIDTGALSGQLYVLVETATGSVFSKAITVASTGEIIVVPAGPIR